MRDEQSQKECDGLMIMMLTKQSYSHVRGSWLGYVIHSRLCTVLPYWLL
jgi:hypothetical protein